MVLLDRPWRHCRLYLLCRLYLNYFNRRFSPATIHGPCNQAFRLTTESFGLRVSIKHCVWKSETSDLMAKALIQNIKTIRGVFVGQKINSIIFYLFECGAVEIASTESAQKLGEGDAGNEGWKVSAFVARVWGQTNFDV